MFFNPKRRHSYNHGLPPIEYERQYLLKLETYWKTRNRFILLKGEAEGHGDYLRLTGSTPATGEIGAFADVKSHCDYLESFFILSVIPRESHWMSQRIKILA